MEDTLPISELDTIEIDLTDTDAMEAASPVDVEAEEVVEEEEDVDHEVVE